MVSFLKQILEYKTISGTKEPVNKQILGIPKNIFQESQKLLYVEDAKSRSYYYNQT